jgi:hypothetical protein
LDVETYIEYYKECMDRMCGMNGNKKSKKWAGKSLERNQGGRSGIDRWTYLMKTV